LSFGVFSQVQILNENFQSGQIPLNYTIVDNDTNIPASQVLEFTSMPWIVVTDPDSSTNLVAASTSYFTSPGKADEWLITSALNLGAFGNIISWNSKSHDPSFPDDYLVLVSTTDTQLSSFIDTIGSVEQENFEWTNREVNLSTHGYNNQTIYVAFRNVTYDGFKLYLDDITVRKEDPAGINEMNKDLVKIYPNPFAEMLHIQTNENVKSIKIQDLNGKNLVETTEKSINLSTLNPGYYIVVLNSDKQVFTYKVLKF
jgi:hypothetical protein